MRPTAAQLQGLLPRRAADASARSHRNTRVAAQLVYNEYIANKTHIHMNGAFRYSSGALFVKPGYD